MPVKIIELNPSEVAYLRAALGAAAKGSGRRFRLAIDDDTFKWKVGEGMWTPGYGRLDPDSDYVARLRRLAEEAKERLAPTPTFEGRGRRTGWFPC